MLRGDLLTLTVGAVVKNEFIDILDWVVYHKTVGVSGFSIADDRSYDGTLEVLEALALVYPVFLIRDFSRRPHPQINAYARILEVSDGEIVLFLDADEFIHSSSDELAAHSIANAFTDEKVSAVAINWRLVGHGANWTGPYGAAIRFPGYWSGKMLEANHHIKTAVRKTRVERMAIHHAVLTSGLYVHTDGSLHTNLGPKSEEVVHEPVAILHYAATGNYENFLLRRKWRGDAVSPDQPVGGKSSIRFYDNHNANGPECTLDAVAQNAFDAEWARVAFALEHQTLLMQEFRVTRPTHDNSAGSKPAFLIKGQARFTGVVVVECLENYEVHSSRYVWIQDGEGQCTLEVPDGQDLQIRVKGSLSGRLIISKNGEKIVEDEKYSELTFRLARAERLLLAERLRNIELQKKLEPFLTEKILPSEPNRDAGQ